MNKMIIDLNLILAFPIDNHFLFACVYVCVSTKKNVNPQNNVDRINIYTIQRRNNKFIP